MEKSPTDTHRRTVRKTEMEMDRPHTTETTKYYNKTSTTVESTRNTKTGKTKRDMEKMCGERKRENGKDLAATSKDVSGQRKVEDSCLWPIS